MVGEAGQQEGCRAKAERAAVRAARLIVGDRPGESRDRLPGADTSRRPARSRRRSSGTYLGHAVSLGELRLDPAGNLMVLGGAGLSRTFESAPIGQQLLQQSELARRCIGWARDGDDHVRGRHGRAGRALVGRRRAAGLRAERARHRDAPRHDPPGRRHRWHVTLPAQPSFTQHILPLSSVRAGCAGSMTMWRGRRSRRTLRHCPIRRPAPVLRVVTNVVLGILPRRAGLPSRGLYLPLAGLAEGLSREVPERETSSPTSDAAPPDPLAPETLTARRPRRRRRRGLLPGHRGRHHPDEDVPLHAARSTFRLDHAKTAAGDLTALMALPWQADFLKCGSGGGRRSGPTQVPSADLRAGVGQRHRNHQDLVDGDASGGRDTATRSGRTGSPGRIPPRPTTVSEWSGDVIVAGAGPAGSTCATLLGRAGLRVLLADGRGSGRWQPVEILAPATVQMLRTHRLCTATADRGYGVCRGVLGQWHRERAFLDYQLFACDSGLAVTRDLRRGARRAGGRGRRADRARHDGGTGRRRGGRNVDGHPARRGWKHDRRGGGGAHRRERTSGVEVGRDPGGPSVFRSLDWDRMPPAARPVADADHVARGRCRRLVVRLV